MNIKHMFELPCHDGRKSFYGKAHVIEDDRGNLYLKSYNTLVCYIDADGCTHKLWNGYSATTQRHINSFFYEFGIDPQLMGKKAWEGRPVEYA